MEYVIMIELKDNVECRLCLHHFHYMNNGSMEPKIICTAQENIYLLWCKKISTICLWFNQGVVVTYWPPPFFGFMTLLSTFSTFSLVSVFGWIDSIKKYKLHVVLWKSQEVWANNASSDRQREREDVQNVGASINFSCYRYWRHNKSIT